jgi:hypothetical protein
VSRLANTARRPSNCRGLPSCLEQTDVQPVPGVSLFERAGDGHRPPVGNVFEGDPELLVSLGCTRFEGAECLRPVVSLNLIPGRQSRLRVSVTWPFLGFQRKGVHS